MCFYGHIQATSYTGHKAILELIQTYFWPENIPIYGLVAQYWTFRFKKGKRIIDIIMCIK